MCDSLEELDLLFISNNSTSENVWAPTGDEPLLNKRPPGDEVEHDNQSDFTESFNTTIVSDSIEMVDQRKEARKKKLKKSIGETPTRRET